MIKFISFLNLRYFISLFHNSINISISGYGAPKPSSGYGAPGGGHGGGGGSSYGPPDTGYGPPDTGYGAPSGKITNDKNDWNLCI